MTEYESDCCGAKVYKDMKLLTVKERVDMAKIGFSIPKSGYVNMMRCRQCYQPCNPKPKKEGK